jgi:hypothetical protein
MLTPASSIMLGAAGVLASCAAPASAFDPPELEPLGPLSQADVSSSARPALKTTWWSVLVMWESLGSEPNAYREQAER